MTLYDIPVTLPNGTITNLTNYQGDVLLIVNTATGCGLTPQYTGLQHLYDTYHTKGFHVLDFPCNQFMNQAPGDNAEIDTFCRVNYNTTFPRFAKIDVNGKQEAPIFTHLKAQQGGLFSDAIKWNFTKFLVDRSGNVIKRYSPQTEPDTIAKDIEKLL